MNITREILRTVVVESDDNVRVIFAGEQGPPGPPALSDPDLTTIAALDSATPGAIASDGAGWIKKTYAQFKTAMGLVKADVGLTSVDDTSDLNKPVSTAQQAVLNLKEILANRDAPGGYAGLTLLKLNLRNAANTITSFFTSAATVARTWTLPDKDGTVAMTADITGTNSGVNTGDQTNISGSAASFTGALAGDVSGTQSATVVGKINGTALATLATGIVKNTTTTGVPSIAAAGTDYVAPTGSGAGLTGITAAQVGAPSGSGTSTGTNTGDQDLSALAPKNAPMFTDSISILGDSPNKSQVRSGTLEFQTFSINNSWIAENAYYNAGWLYRSTGTAALFYFNDGEGQFRVFPSGAAGTPLPNGGGTTQLKILSSNVVALGGVMDAAPTSLVGATMIVRPTGVGIGVIVNTALLHLKAGSAAAGTAPAKLTAGPVMTTPEAGAFEFDGTNLFFTVGTLRKTVTLT